MSHHRDVVTALARPPPSAPTRTPCGPADCSSAPGRSRSTPRAASSSATTPAEQAQRCLENLANVCAGRRGDPRRRRAPHRLPDRHGRLRRRQRGLRRLLRGRPAGPRGDRRRRAAQGRAGRDRRDRRDAGLMTGPVTAADIRTAREHIRERGPPHAGAHVAHVLRARRRHGAAQGREPPAHRLVQAPRRAREDRRPRRGGLRARRGDRQRRQPRPGAGLRRPHPRRPVRGVHAARGARLQGRCRLARRAPTCASGSRPSTTAWPRPAPTRPRPAPRSCTRSTTPRSSPGRAALGLELLEDVPDLAKVVVPVGGGGLASGIAIAVKSARPDVEVVGVQARACAPFPESLRRGETVVAESTLTIADGIAVKRPGELTLAADPGVARRRRLGRRGRDRRGDGDAARARASSWSRARARSASPR